MPNLTLDPLPVFFRDTLLASISVQLGNVFSCFENFCSPSSRRKKRRSARIQSIYVSERAASLKAFAKKKPEKIANFLFDIIITLVRGRD